MKLYEVKALAHETQSRIRQDLNAWNDFLEHASRVYRYRFMDQILIYAQRPDAVACATMNIWNSKMGCWIKKGNRGIALIDESNSRKLKYVWDVTSVVPKMGGHLPRLWIRKPYHTETIQNRLLKVYGLQPQTDKYDTKEPSIEHTMDYLVEYLADEYAADIAQEKYSSDNSPLSELDEEKYKMDEYRRNVRVFFRYGLNRMIKERMGLSTGGFPDYDMSFIKDLPESDFCELSSRMTDAAQQALREVGIAVLTYDRVHGIDRDPSVDYNALKRKSAEREDETYGTRIHQSRGLRDTEPYTEQGTTGAADEIRTYAQDLAQKELQGEVRYDANVRGTSGTLPKGTEESTGRDGQNRAADEKTGRSDRAAEDAGPAEMDTNDEQHPEQSRGNSEGYSDLHFVENEIVPESGTDEDEYVPESGTGLYFMPELPTEDEQRIKVEKYGYLNPRKADYIPHDYIRQVMLRGTGFEGGFDRVVQIFQNEMEAGKRTALIKKEYGLGGASWPVDGMGLHGYDTYGSQGIRFQWRDEQGEAEGTLSWSSVEQEIGTLILTGEYKSRDRQNNDIIPETEESDHISQTTEMQEQSTDKYKSEAPEQLSFTDFINIEPDKTENDTQPEALDETEAEHPDNAEQQNNEDFTERAADYTALLVLAEADASTLTKRQKAQRNISALKILKQIENEKRPATADERVIMSAYLGWGGIPEIFDAENVSWSEEYGILKSLLTTTEYDSARASTLNAHFTDTAVINAMYDVLHNLGFTKGNILEPSMGIGNFFSGLPADMSASKLYGVELDPVTGRMAQLIYPDAHIEVKGYEKTDFQNDFFDVAIGNVPFGQYKVIDKAYDKHNFYIHDYFFAKTIDKVRPGGVIAFITSKGTMDKANPSVRRYIAQRTQLLGAIRLPNDAFKNAGTSVTSDIIFLKKRDMYIDTDEDWIHLGTDENGIEMNSYFVNNPHMVLGQMEMVSGPHGMESACVPESGTLLADRLRQAVQMIRGEISIDDTEISDEELEDESIPAEAGVKNFSYCSLNGKIYYRENSIMRPQDIPEKTAERMKGLIDVRDSVSELIELQLDDASDEEIRASQARLNGVYDSFVKKFGYLNSRTNQTAFREDAGYSLISSLEETDDDGKVAGKADMFTKRTIRKAVPVTHVDTSVIFCDASTPRSDGGFDVYHAIKDKLIAKGVPDKEIAFIHDANTKKQKAELFSKVRSGQVRFLLGSTAKMGAGTNVQTRLIALHHIDVPWRPSDIEQQEGRILRQGNRNERVKIFRYVTENTFDSYSWQLIENKQKFIGQIMTSKSPVRSCDDVDEAALSYAEVKALATGNPYIKEKMTLDTEVAKLKLLKANFKSQKYRLEDAINKEYPVRIAKLEEKIEGLRQDIITRGSEEILSDGFEIRINGVLYDDKKEGGAALIAAAKESKTPERTMIGDYKGFKLYSRFDAFFNLYYIHMQGRCEHTIEMSSDPAGMITRLNNCMAGFEKRLSDAQDALDETRIELETAEKEVTKKFDKEDILSEKLKRLSFLNAQLDADRKETPQNAPQNKQAQRNDIKEKYISI